MQFIRMTRRGVAVLPLLLSVAAASLAAAQGTVSGRIVAQGSNEPIPGARVIAIGTSLFTTSSADGRYQLRNLPAGTVEVRVLRVGFAEQKKPVTVANGQPSTLDFTLTPVAIKLQEVVTTATGEQRKVELGNAVQTLGDIGAKVETAPVKNLADLLVAKAPGVQVQGANMTGATPVVRIRGIKSLSLTSEPIYVIDGVRMNAGTINIGTGGTTVSLLNVLNPEEIADIEIVKGPSAATLYGTDAANGVIVVTTKKGLVGPARWTAHAGTGLVQDRNNYPTQYAIFGHAPATPTVPKRCTNLTIADLSCIADSTTSYNLLADPALSPIHDGATKQLGLQVSGGSDAVRYFVSGDYEGERGPLEMPSFSQNYLTSTGNAIQEAWLHPETFSRKSARGNLNAALNPKVDLQFNSGYTRSSQQLPPVDNNTASFLYNAYNNPGFKPTTACQTNKVSCLGYTDTGALGEELGGYGFYTPGNLFQRLNTLNVDRFISSLTSQYRPLAWLQGDATLGLDIASRDQVRMCLFNQCQNSGTTRQGFVFDRKDVDRNLTAKASATGTWQAKPALNLRTTLGVDYTNLQTEFATAEGDNLPPGAQTAGAGAIAIVDNSFPRASKTLGYYAQEQAAINDRLFVTLAARTDQNSAFGTAFQRVIYPKASVSYIVSDESYFPKPFWLDQLRLRGAYGASGVQPGSTTALQTYGATSLNVASTPTAISGTDTPGLLASALGNPELKPERSTEREAGFETRMFNSRVNFEFTYYNNVTKDALINQPIAGSSGASSTGLTVAPVVTRNLGSIRNSGIEATLTTTLVDLRSVTWDLTVGGSHNNNKIESLGFQACVINTTDCLTGSKPNPTIGTGANRDSLGMPIRGVYARNYTYSDANGNGIIEPTEVKVDANVSYVGEAIPKDLVTVQSGLDLFEKKLHLSVLLDYKGGYSLFNSSTQFYCLNTNTCYDITHPTASLDDQARLVAMRFTTAGDPNKTTRGYWENGQFWRLREVGATFSVPGTLMNRVGARDASLTLTARNLHVWTKYKGTDPESGYTTDNLQNVQNDFSTLSPPTYFTVRLNLHF